MTKDTAAALAAFVRVWASEHTERRRAFSKTDKMHPAMTRTIDAALVLAESLEREAAAD